MLSSNASFISLPPELHSRIIAFLDPISLISLAHADTYFRGLIAPLPCHFTARLLALELDHRYAGPTPVFYPDLPYASAVVPSFDDDAAWSTIRYACTSCLKLLSHWAFDNHSIMRKRYCKLPPLPGVIAAPLGGWEPPIQDAKARGLRIQRHQLEDRLEKAELRARIVEAYPDLQMESLPLEYCAKRHLRMCNECRYENGDWSRHTDSNLGTPHTPVIKSRPKKFHGPVERYFPGLVSPPNGNDARAMPSRYPIRQKVYRQHDRTNDFWILHMVRCPTCAEWLELRHFRQGGPAHYKATPVNMPHWNWLRPGEVWNGPHFDTWRCNACVLRDEGVEALALALLTHWRLMANSERSLLRSINSYGWHFVAMYMSRETVTWAHVVESSKPPRGDLTIGEWTVANKLTSCPSSDEADVMDHSIVKALFACWSWYLESELKSSGRWQALKDAGEISPWFETWNEDFYVKEERWEVLTECDEAFEKDPTLLVDYAIEAMRTRP